MLLGWRLFMPSPIRATALQREMPTYTFRRIELQPARPYGFYHFSEED